MKNNFKTIAFLAFVILCIIACSDNQDQMERSVDSVIAKSVDYHTETNAESYIADYYEQVPVLVSQSTYVNENDISMIISQYALSGTLSEKRIYATSFASTESIEYLVELDWNNDTVKSVEVYWDITENATLSWDYSDLSEEDDLVALTVWNSNQQQNVVPKFRNRGFGWTCGPVVDLPGGSFRTCCHRLFWRLTQDCDQYSAGDLPGSNPRIVSF